MLDPNELQKQLATDSRKQLGEEPKSLGPVTTLHIDVVGSRGRRYMGDFVFKVPTLLQQIEVGRLKTAYLPAGAATDPNAYALCEQLCYLQITIDQKSVPSWWKPAEMFDATPVSALYREAISYELRFHGRDPLVAADQDAAVDGGGDAGRAAAQDPTDVVGGVSASPQRREVIFSHGEGSA